MWTMTIAGTRSGVGKTVLGCRLLAGLPGWGALKCSVHAAGAGHAGEGGAIVTDRAVLAAEGTDTARYLDAGARRVVWLRVTPDRLAVEFERALGSFEGLRGVIVEGSSHLAHHPTDRTVMVARIDREEIKPSARKALAIADRLVLRGGGRAAAAETGEWLGHAGLSRATPVLVALDLDDPEDPAVSRLRRDLATWFRP